jgi:serine/threonine protein kinase
VCDFGFARKAEPKADHLTICGTYGWMAPEVYRGNYDFSFFLCFLLLLLFSFVADYRSGEKYDTRADVFSYGMVLCELVTRRKPPKRVADKAFAFDPLDFETRCPAGTPPQLFDLIVSCAQFDPEKVNILSSFLLFYFVEVFSFFYTFTLLLCF